MQDLMLMFKTSDVNEMKYKWPDDIDILHGRSEISLDDSMDNQRESIEELEKIKYFLTPLFLQFIPKDLSILPNEYFKLMNTMFQKKFGISIDDILMNEINDDIDSLSYREYVMSFVIYLHSKLSQLDSMDSILTDTYATEFNRISKKTIIKIYQFFNGLIVI